jgi:hypothetical protein
MRFTFATRTRDEMSGFSRDWTWSIQGWSGSTSGDLTDRQPSRPAYTPSRPASREEKGVGRDEDDGSLAGCPIDARSASGSREPVPNRRPSGPRAAVTSRSPMPHWRLRRLPVKRPHFEEDLPAGPYRRRPWVPRAEAAHGLPRAMSDARVPGHGSGTETASSIASGCNAQPRRKSSWSSIVP